MKRQRAWNKQRSLHQPRLKRAGAAAGIGIIAAVCLAGAVNGADLILEYDVNDRPIEPGEQITITLSMADLDTAAAGFQAFLEFDNTQMFLVGGSYTDEPFDLAILPVVASGDEIDLAAGINNNQGQQPSIDDAVLVEMTFQATDEFCTPTIGFREHNPPTRLTDDRGNPILPLDTFGLQEPVCLGDIETPAGDGQVNTQDLLYLLSQWGSDAPNRADIAPDGCDGQVNTADLLELLANWGPCR